ncbi:KTSC domain-containing protein [Brevundimonas sp. BR2-1]|uniref:KTSC domain-containing protein n=1 Tax=unclassified Brevundimonas TaxID=2622653 RepID=UPI002FCB9B9D
MPSSVIRQFSYDEPRRRLRITFTSGDVYDYLDVPPMVPDGLRAAGSKGRFFSARIRDRFAFERIRIAAP